MMAQEYTGEVIPAKEYTGEVVQDNPRGNKRADTIFGMPKLGAADIAKAVPTAGAEFAMNMGSSMLAKPAGDVVGLASILTHALGITDRDPAEMQKMVQEGLTYEPRGKVAQGMGQLASLPGRAISGVANYAGDKVEGGLGSSVLGNLTRGTIENAPLLLPGLGKKPVEGMVGREAERLAIEKQKRTDYDANLNQAKEAGYVIPSALVKEGSATGKALESPAGKAKTEQAFSVKNQETTNKLARQDLDLPEGAAITPERLAERRKDVYSRFVDDLGDSKSAPIKPTQTYFMKMRNVFAPYQKLVEEAPGTFRSSEIEALYKDFQENFQGKDVATGHILKRMDIPAKSVDSIIGTARELRSDATRDLMSKDNATKARLGKIKIEVANALDDLLEENFRERGNYRAVGALRSMREGIAKTYDYEKALNWATGDVSASKLAALAGKRPLSGNAKTIATFGKQFPKAAQEVTKIGSQPYFSPWDSLFAVGELAAGHPGAAVAGIASRGILPQVGMTPWYQNRFVKPPSYQPGLGYRALEAGTSPGMTPFLMDQGDQQ